MSAPAHDLETAENTVEDSIPRASGPDIATLTVAFEAERPLAPPRRFPLPRTDVVRIGRRTGDVQPNELAIGLPDPFVSTPHASLRWIGDRWVLEDDRSRNGTFVDGAPIETCELRDGAIIEVGHTFLVFRAEARQERDATGVDEVPTLHAGFAAQLRDLRRVAGTDVPVMVRGETGTGKELLARAVHRLSGRGGSFQAINCAALAPSLAESELFGYRKGAFSGAAEDRPGLIRAAEGGTLFLDEVGDLSPAVQAALLRVLQELEVLPVGATRPVPVNFRLVVATHRDLEELVATGQFRSDLLARLQGLKVALPPLRERKEDLGLILAALLRRHAADGGRGVRFSLRAARTILLSSWPLNVRQLERALVLSLSLANEGRIEATHFPALAASHPPAPPAQDERLSPEEERQRAELVAALRANAGNVTATAKTMGKARQQVQRWMRRHGLSSTSFR